ncbi:MAG: DUF2780 domain-containing protein [Limnothrix sp. RL_2_0]|nr:DUF2780 domain-containing protein [Limnothrix sp. RL_2_0]
MELIQLLTSQLGVSEEQAKGGSGLLLKLAKEKLDSGEFDKVKESVPGIEALLSAAPDSGAGGMAATLGGLASSFGGSAGQLGALASLAGGFKSLDMDAGMVSKFIPIIMSFVQSEGSDTAKQLLEQAMKR